MSDAFEIRLARPEEYEHIGRLTVDAYMALPGMPAPGDAPEFQGYYDSLRDTAGRAAEPAVEILVAANPDGRVVGSVSFIAEMQAYGADAAADAASAAGIRMLAVAGEAQGHGLGRRLTEACIERSRALGRQEVVLHTTGPMEIARGMYERMGFVRAPELDFSPAGFLVMGYRLPLGT